MIPDLTRCIVATMSTRTARFGSDAESGLLTMAWTPMVNTPEPTRRMTGGRPPVPAWTPC